MHTPNLKVWTKALRDPDLMQVHGALVKDENEDGRIGYCCLGVGCVEAGMDVDAEGEVIVLDGEMYGALPPTAFHIWLGLDRPGWKPEVTADIYPDWDFITRDGQEAYDVTCANLNDEWNLTFVQIADILDYFGIRG